MTEERKVTAPMTSVGAEVGQSPDLTPTIIPDYGENFNPSKEEIFLAQQEYEQEMQAQAKTEYENSPGFMQTVSMPELYEMVYSGKPPIIEHFLYPGTYLFVGAPKVGKSFMMAQIAYHVSSGTPMWNYSVRKGTVLYLALEDDYRRLQERLYRMFGTETVSNLFFSVASKSLNDGLIEQLGAFLENHPDTSLVIIDTLQKVRETEGDTYSYARDYDIIAGLKAFADRTGICLLLVHHTRKQKSDDNSTGFRGQMVCLVQLTELSLCTNQNAPTVMQQLKFQAEISRTGNSRFPETRKLSAGISKENSRQITLNRLNPCLKQSAISSMLTIRLGRERLPN